MAQSGFFTGNPTPIDIANLNTLVAQATANAAAAAASATTSTNEATIATTQAGIATTQAGISTTQAGISTTQAGIATTQAVNAAASATTATTQAGIATTQAGNASTSATNAANSATASAGSATSALNNWNNFQDTYYGALASDPTLNPTGGAIRNGDMYYNTTSNALRVRVSGAWQNNPSTAGYLLAANALSELAGVAGTARGNILAAKSGANTDITSITPSSAGTIDNMVLGGTTPKAATVTSMNGGSLAGFRNRIINGNFSQNQRIYVSGAALVAAAYGHDRWKAGASGCTYTFTAGVPDTTITITANTLTQVIDGINVEGGTYRLSWSGTAQARVYQGSPSGTYSASPVAVSGMTAGTNIIIEFNTGTLGLVQVEPGSVSTPFERRPVGIELALCQRYCFQMSAAQHFPLGGSGYADSTTAGSVVVSFPVTMRAVPTVSYSSLELLASGGGFVLVTGVGGGTRLTTSLAALYLTVASGLTAGQAITLAAANSGGGLVTFSAEL